MVPLGTGNGRIVQKMPAVVFSDDEDDSMALRPLPPVPENRGPPVIPLATLIDFAVQKIYHELTVLSELLPKKLDADRKISIVEFAQGTRLLFIKLLAIVKWVKAAKKVDTCTAISQFLDQQAVYFIDTADKLVTLARDELINARIPAFQIPSAVDVLTIGQYPRLPVCIKSRFLVEGALTDREQSNVLRRLNQVIQYRIASAARSLPARIKEVVIRNGMVTLVVPGEFEASLTLLGELPTTPWTLLNIKALVEDYDIGYGTNLVHPLQIHFIHQVAQARMSAAVEPITELYNVVHAFAQSLQLDLLYCQTSALIAQRLRNYVTIEKYVETKELVVCYWQQQRPTTGRSAYQRQTAAQASSASQFKICIGADVGNPSGGLKVRHVPATATDLPDLDDASGRLCIERLLSETVAVRCRQRLARLQQRLGALTGERPAMTGDAMPSLTVALLGAGDSHPDELLSVAVNMFSGLVLARVPALGLSSELRDLERLLNDGSSDAALNHNIDRLRVLLMMERCRKCVSLLPVRLVDETMLLSHAGKLSTIPRDRVCLQLIKEEYYYLILTFVTDRVFGVKIDFYLLSASDTQSNLMQLQPSQMVQTFAAASLTAGSDSKEDDDEDGPPKKKRKRWLGNAVELAAAVATIDDRIAFLRTTEELDRRGIHYRQVETEPVVGGLRLRITSFGDTVEETGDDFFEKLVSCCMRLDVRAHRVTATFECLFADPPLFGQDARVDANGRWPTHRTVVSDVALPNPSTAGDFVSILVDRVLIYSKLYSPVKRFAVAFNRGLDKHVKICAYTYHKLVLAYGPNHSLLLTLNWRHQDRQFHLYFGTMPSGDGKAKGNPHTLMTALLTASFNKRQDLTHLVQLLIDTATPLSALYHMVRMRLQFNKYHAIQQTPETNSNLPMSLHNCLIPVSETIVRLVFGVVTLEFIFLSGNRVAVRDASRAPCAAGLHVFWKQFSRADLLIDTIDNDDSQPPTDTKFSPVSGSHSAPQLTSPATQPTPSPAANVATFPATPKVVPSPMSAMPGSVGESENNPSYPSSVRPTEAALTASRTPVLIDHEALATVTRCRDDGSCPLDDYLFGVAFLLKMAPILRASAYGDHQSQRDQGQQAIRNLQIAPDSIKFHAIGSSVDAEGRQTTWNVTYHIFIEQSAESGLALRMKLDFSGTDTPEEQDIAIAEEYFVRFVAPLFSEHAIVSFVSICRLTSKGVFAALVQIMASQMETQPSSPSAIWRVSLQLITSNAPRCGVQIDLKGVNLLICIKLRPAHQNDLRASEPLSIPLIYTIQQNSIKPANSGGNNAEHPANQMLLMQSKAAQAVGDCCIWMAVRHLMERYEHRR